ncbi:hypothetical protein [Baaleninema sp.]|uniref:hypothetical protein n=1 Tax=Baaleninema sp. TaxID=3101197 RepID=UPI003CFE00BB
MKQLTVCWGMSIATAILSWSAIARALPPADDPPEEILRTEIVLEARSPIDGEPLTPAEYAQLQAELQQPNQPPQLSSDVRYNLFLLRLLKLIRTVTPL